MSVNRRYLNQALAVIFAMLAWSESSAQEWKAVADVNLEVAAGSVLDFSVLSEGGPAGKYGWATVIEDGKIGFEKLRQQQRFFSASFAFSPASGGFPDREEADRIVQQLKRTGYNAVRLQNVDANLMSGRTQDFDFDPLQFDRFQYLFSRLKAAGMYMILDVMYLDNGGFGGIFPHRWIKKFNLRRDLYIDPAARSHWLRLLTTMIGQRNKYTETIPIQDPALLGLILVNEGGVAELAYREGGGFNGSFSPFFAPEFRNWLRTRYKTDEALKVAWAVPRLAACC